MSTCSPPTTASACTSWPRSKGSASARRARPARSCRAAASRSAASCRATPAAGCSPRATCRAGITSPSWSAAQLADQLGLVIPALHVALGEHPAAGVARQLAADLDAAALHERAGLALLAEAEPFERGQEVHAEAVVGGEHVDILRRHASTSWPRSK